MAIDPVARRLIGGMLLALGCASAMSAALLVGAFIVDVLRDISHGRFRDASEGWAVLKRAALGSMVVALCASVARGRLILGPRRRV